MYHHWHGVVPLLWIGFSFLPMPRHLERILKVNFYVIYLNFLLVFYFIINVSNPTFEEMSKSADHARWGFFRFKLSILEIGMQVAVIFLMVYWSKLLKDCHELHTGLRTLGFLIFEKYNFQDYKWLSMGYLVIPIAEYSLLVLVLLVASSSRDLFHLAFLVLFVAMLAVPSKIRQITQFMVIWSFVFLLLSYVFSLAHQEWVTANNELLQALGVINERNELPDQWEHFAYRRHHLETLAMFGGFAFLKLRIMFEYTELDDQFYIYAQVSQNFCEKFPRVGKILNAIYELKQGLQYVVVFALYLSIIFTQDTSLLHFVYMLLTFMLIYRKLHEVPNLRRESCLWLTISVYSSLVIIFAVAVTIASLFKNFEGVKKLVSLVPELLQKHPNIIGLDARRLRPVSDKQDEAEQTQWFSNLLPNFVFLISSVFIRNRLQFLYEEKTQVKEVIQQLLDQDTAENEDALDEDGDLQFFKRRLKANEEVFDQLRFFTLYQSFKLKKFWWILDLLSEYYIVLQLLITFLLMIKWWYNGALMVLVFLQLVAIMRVVFALDRIRNQQSQDYRQERGSLQQPSDVFDEQSFFEKRREFKHEVTQAMVRIQLVTWKLSFIWLTLCLLGCVLSFHVMTVRDFFKAKGFTTWQHYTEFLMYYSFLGGTFNKSEGQSNLVKSTVGYVIFLILSFIGRICLYWLRDRFDCTDAVFDVIKRLID